MRQGTCEVCRRMRQWINRSEVAVGNEQIESKEVCGDCYQLWFPGFMSNPRTDFQHDTGGGQRIITKGTEMS